MTITESDEKLSIYMDTWHDHEPCWFCHGSGKVVYGFGGWTPGSGSETIVTCPACDGDGIDRPIENCSVCGYPKADYLEMHCYCESEALS